MEVRRVAHRQLAELLLLSQPSEVLRQVVPHVLVAEVVADSRTLHLPIALQKLE
jgi:hypothetical protein